MEAKKKITRCIECGGEIEYKTNKPKRCKKCKEKRGTRARKKNVKSKPFIKWKKETQMFHMLSSLFNAPCVMNGYYSNLRSPKGEPMQLDWYCPDCKVAYEYQGRQHYEYSSYFHKSKTAFKYLQECDRLKAELCEKNGIILIPIKYDKRLTERYLLLKLKEADFNLYSRLINKGYVNKLEK